MTPAVTADSQLSRAAGALAVFMILTVVRQDTVRRPHKVVDRSPVVAATVQQPSDCETLRDYIAHQPAWKIEITDADGSRTQTWASRVMTVDFEGFTEWPQPGARTSWITRDWHDPEPTRELASVECQPSVPRPDDLVVRYESSAGGGPVRIAAGSQMGRVLDRLLVTSTTNYVHSSPAWAYSARLELRARPSRIVDWSPEDAPYRITVSGRAVEIYRGARLVLHHELTAGDRLNLARWATAIDLESAAPDATFGPYDYARGTLYADGKRRAFALTEYVGSLAYLIYETIDRDAKN